MALYIRMALYFLFGSLAGQGWLEWDAVNKTVLISVDDMVPALMGGLGFIGTFFASRVAAARGGAT